MAITIVGTPQANAVADGGGLTLTFDGSPVEGDVVYLFGGTGNTAEGTNGPSTGGYTELFDAGNGPDAGVWRKVLGATPDSNVVCQGSGNNQHATAYASIVLRGVDTTTPEDATPTQDTLTSPPPITTVTDGAWVIAGGADWWSDVPTGAPSGYSNGKWAGAIDTAAISTALATKEVATAGTEDPGEFTSWAGPQWSWTIAVRPFIASGEIRVTESGLFVVVR